MRSHEACIALAILFATLAPPTLSQECGIPITDPSKNGRIVGGNNVGVFRYPWFVSLQLPFLNHPVCGGALIHKNYVVTAAHCFDVSPKEKHTTTYLVVLGVYDQCEEDEPTKQTFPIKRVVIHENYKPRGKFFDIALIEISEPATAFTPVCLPQIKARVKSKFGLVMGMGVTKSGGDQPCELQELDVRVYTSKECVKSRLPLVVVREPSILCAGFLEGGKDSCQGDSGGPLQVIGAKKQWVLRGLVSFGYGCAREGLPGVYTSVAHYVTWLQEQTGEFANETLVVS